MLQLESGRQQKLRNGKRKQHKAKALIYRNTTNRNPRRLLAQLVCALSVYSRPGFLCLRPGLYSKIYRNLVSHKAIILHLINNLIISALTARAADRAASRAEAFQAGQMPCHALLWRRHWFAMLLDSHFLLMQSLKYLQCDDLNVFSTTIIHIEDKGCPLQNYPLNFFENVNL